MSSNNRDSCIFYRSFYEAISELPDASQANLYKAIFEYTLNFTEVELQGIEKTVFKLIKPQLDANNKRYKNGITPKSKQDESKIEAKDNQDSIKDEANENVNDNVNENNNVNPNPNENNNDKGGEKPKKKNFTKPTIDEIAVYCRERNNTINAEHFFNYYEAIGWKVGSNAMKDWKATIRTWESRDNKNTPNRILFNEKKETSAKTLDKERREGESEEDYLERVIESMLPKPIAIQF